MNAIHRSAPLWLLLSAAVVPSVVGGCSDAGAREARAAALGALEDQPLPAFQTELLDLAFQAASAMPVMPHIKNRSRAQEAVVTTCLELDQPQRARAFIEGIDNWRRGVGHADLAFYLAKHGATEAVAHEIELAQRASDKALADEDSQEWHVDRIRAKIARTYLWLGQTDKGAELAAGLQPAEAEELEALKARLAEEATFDQQLLAAEAAVASGGFDQVRNALASCAELFDRFYADAERRSRAEERIKASWVKLPVQLRIELLMELSTFAREHDDQPKALALLAEARLVMDSCEWTAEDRVPLLARLAEHRHHAGDVQAARSEVDAALALFTAERARIVDIYRADALRPVAEAYRALGDVDAAVRVYAQVVEEGATNPNARPRAEDLSATCLSMARNRVDPGVALRARIVEIRGGLSDPW